MKYIQLFVLANLLFCFTSFSEVMVRNEDNKLLYSSVFYNVDNINKVVFTQSFNERRGDEIFLRITMSAENRMEFDNAKLFLEDDVLETDIIDSFVSTVDDGKFVSTVVYRLYVLDKDEFLKSDKAKLEIYMPTAKDIIWLVPRYVFEEWKEIIRKID